MGPSGSGKSTFAAAHFAPTEVLSTDFFRALASDDESDQRASGAAFAVVRFLAVRRLRRGRRTCVDATNLRRRDRRPLLAIALRYRRRAIAVVFETPLETCLERNRSRARRVADDIVAEQWDRLPRPASSLAEEGFELVYTVSAGGG